MEQDLLNWVFGLFMALVGWLGRTLWSAVDALKKDVKEIEIGLPSHYVRKDDMDVRFDKIEAILNRLFEKLENKADK